MPVLLTGMVKKYFGHAVEEFNYLFILQNKINPYIEFLRSIQSIPQWCTFYNDKYPRQLIHKMNKHLNKYNQSRNKFSQYNDEEFKWAYYTINTRCVHFDMEIDSKDQDNNLCLISYLDFVNHSIESSTISKFNHLTHSYEIRTIKSIDLNEQITFLYNSHSNVDLFIEYGFILSSNPYNQLNIEYELEQILSNQQIQLIKSFNY
ncbi:unnamed protein product [Didymodactylos carnosus]|uniref:SET domain-containing protein n=1 Tax=Didymodactylos carnosus TaxID=1234261 RepID=A0A815T4T5_9BILA|nr:unnamed protein product [Didymodactylos carnosus]CAF4359510.1 unnamed protein product [Didymodactylos carnosus]